MTRSTAVLVLAATAALATGPAFAQGTDAQREACAPDAVRLCQDTIPDIPKTTACMKAHFAQLSPRCKVAFNAVTGAPPKAARREAEAPPPRAEAPPPRAEAPDEAARDTAAATPPQDQSGLHAYEAQIRGYCRQGLIDPFTCRHTLATLRGME